MRDLIWTWHNQASDICVTLGLLVIIAISISVLIGHIPLQTTTKGKVSTYLRWQWRWLFKSTSPPRIPSLPFVGSLPFLPRAVPVFIAYHQLTKRYGNVFIVTQGIRKLVVVNGGLAVREFLSHGKAVASRPLLRRIQIHNPLFLGLADSPYSSHWREQRKFCLVKLRTMSCRSAMFEEYMRQGLVNILSEISDKRHCPFNPLYPLQNCIANLMCNVVLGTNYKVGDANFIKLTSLVKESLELTSSETLRDYIPMLKYLTAKTSADNKLLSVRKELMSFIEHHIQYPSEYGMLFEFNKEMKKGPHTMEEEQYTSFTPDQRLYLLLDLFNAGSETTMLTLQWGLLYLANNQHCQAKMQHELDQCGRHDDFIMYKTGLDLPYCEAVLLEIQRMASVVPLSLPHVTIEPVQIGEYELPSNTTVITNLWSVHRDPTIWENPDVFYPERFLSSDNKITNKKLTMPFSEGSRRCVGEYLAKVTIFAFFTNMVKHFKFMPPVGEDSVCEEGSFRISHAPNDFEIRAMPRFDESLEQFWDTGCCSR